MTMEIHHGKHHDAYVTNLNKALESAPDLAAQDASRNLLANNCAIVPENIRTAVRNNGGGHINHSMFWQILAPERRRQSQAATWPRPSTAPSAASTPSRKSSTPRPPTRFGSGWAWLIKSGKGVEIIFHRQSGFSP